MAWIGGNWAHATNAIQPGSVAASITPASVLAAVCSTHAAASEERQAIAGKLGDVQQRVTQVLVRTAADRQP